MKSCRWIRHLRTCPCHRQSWTACGPCLWVSRAFSSRTSPDTEGKPPLRALDLAQKLREEKLKGQATETPMSASQQRVHDLKGLTKQLQNVHPNVLAKHLHKSVLYQDKDMVVVNKPYGLTLRDGSTTTSSSISSVLPILAKMMDGNKVNSDSTLLPCLGLEKEVTGALLLARSEEAAENIADLQTQHQVIKKYWAVAVGVPVPSEGIIDIPLLERQVTGAQPHYKMSLSPVYKMSEGRDNVVRTRANRQALQAATKYKVLDSQNGCSLVELQPLTDVKHQLRVHMAYALSCPILGDHKYSHWSKLAPQQLPERVLKKLKLEQSKIRLLPLHLHSRQLTIQKTSGAEINMTCVVPKYFFQTLGLLHLFGDPDKKPK